VAGAWLLVEGDGMITAVTGPPGNGKSAYGVRAIALALESGKAVATNIELRDDLGVFVSRKANVIRAAIPGAVARRADRVERHVFSSDDPHELLNVRLRGHGEGRGLMVLDEAPDWLNSHHWNADGRDELVRWFRKHRHYGWDVLLLAQDLEMLDKQVRVNYEQHTHVRNLRRARIYGVPICPVNFFVATTVWHSKRGGAQPIVLRRETYRLGWWKDLYDTHQAAREFAADDPNAIYLPRTSVRPSPESGKPAAANDGPPNVNPMHPDSVLDAKA